jgi:hypothetical protein
MIRQIAHPKYNIDELIKQNPINLPKGYKLNREELYE